MNITFLGSLFPHELQDNIRLNSIGPIANANNALQWSLVDGLRHFYPLLNLIILPQVGAYPLKYKRLLVEGKKIDTYPNVNGESFEFFNLVGVKHLSRYFTTKKAILQRLSGLNNEKHLLFIYDLHAPFLKAAYDLKKTYPNLIICLIVPDIHGYTGTNDSFLYNVFSKLERSFLKKSYQAIDAYVLLSKHMVEKLPIGEKPWTIVEGIFNQNKIDVGKVKVSKLTKIVFYSGSLDRRNGIMRLVKAFLKIEHKDYRLVICGDGDTKEEILNAVKEDSRIDYKGQLERKQVLALQQNSTLLVNPRTSEGEFTRYSFPSKIMEYLASGVPTLLYILEGIPNEYYQYCYPLEDNNISSLTEKIISICEQDPEVLTKKGIEAREFILNHKNPLVQCQKISDLLKTIINRG